MFIVICSEFPFKVTNGNDNHVLNVRAPITKIVLRAQVSKLTLAFMLYISQLFSNFSRS